MTMIGNIYIHWCNNSNI